MPSTWARWSRTASLRISVSSSTAPTRPVASAATSTAAVKDPVRCMVSAAT
ncbi:Uncharacterised protein [Bordetella pertussis]|nr:Uncharacterised protein [Bordetella pertussis]CFP69177.1 Uncharacterised protein [Bordetella pertussis]CFV98627.1 Uncharacterised protein [Bordetella pertussis]